MTVTDETNPQCCHCGNTHLDWVTDPAPDICADCASKGLWSPMWGPTRAGEYQALLRRLAVSQPTEKRNP